MLSKQASFTRFIVAFTLIAAGFASDGTLAERSQLPTTINFNRDIRPIFTEHCSSCHGGVKQAGSISFAYRDQVLPPDGWIVEPGDPESSTLIERVTSDDPDLRMPPPDHGAALSEHEVSLLTKWIKQGATWQDHWAYAPLKPQPVPQVQQNDWPRQPMDAFVLRRLEQEKITPSAPESPERWLRRATLDVIGLPPSLAEREAFLTDVAGRGEAAYETVVDRLLGSPHYGERWASVWLDQIRYADSRGLGADGKRNIWKYRDWVIRALNRDMPYDEFTKKQIAGDLLPDAGIEDLIATAAHRLTQTNEEGGTDDEEFRIAAVLDRVNTVWQTWQGVTFGCVQCHSHPYDPFRHDEYYKFAAFFNNTADCDLSEEFPVLQAPMKPEDYEAAEKLDQQIEQLNNKIWDQEYALLTDQSVWRPLIGAKASTNRATKAVTQRVGEHEEFRTVGTVAQNLTITVEAPVPAELKQLSAIRVTAMPADLEKAQRDSEWGFSLSYLAAELIVPGKEKPQKVAFDYVIADEPTPFFDPQDTLNPKASRGFAAYSRINYTRQGALVLKKPIPVPTGATIRIRLKHNVTALGAFPLIIRRGSLALSSDSRLSDLISKESIKQQRNQLTELRKARKKIPSTSIPIMAERPERFERPQHVFIRGLFLTKDKQVEPGVPASLPPLAEESDADRLDLANWIVSPQNPLTARVAVNRVWARLFGIGLVETEEDFGSSGEPPSHPGLLDYLAHKFQDSGAWRFKPLLRELVLSSTYRQSSKSRADLLERDPVNRLLARGPHIRLPSEMVRDQALAASGLLSDKMYGPPVHPPIPGGIWQPFSGGDKWSVPKPGDEDRYRRAIYTYVKRSIPYPMSDTFDAPTREFCTPRRLRSNTPLQALMTLNDESMVECANALAKRMANHAKSPRERIEYGFLRVTCREATTEETLELLNLYAAELEQDDEQGALATVATVLLNLDEVLTK